MISPGAIIANEVSLGALRRRADLVIADRRLVGFEIKSNSDTLRRLPEQLLAYSSTFDTTILVVGRRHLSNALQIAPKHIGIWLVEDGQHISVRRRPSKRSHSNISGIVSALSLADLERSFSHIGLSRNEWVEVSANFKLSLARSAIAETIRRKFQSTSASFWNDFEANGRSHHDLSQLSRFAGYRKQVAEQREKREKFWDSWTASAGREFEKILSSTSGDQSLQSSSV